MGRSTDAPPAGGDQADGHAGTRVRSTVHTGLRRAHALGARLLHGRGTDHRGHAVLRDRPARLGRGSSRAGGGGVQRHHAAAAPVRGPPGGPARPAAAPDRRRPALRDCHHRPPLRNRARGPRRAAAAARRGRGVLLRGRIRGAGRPGSPRPDRARRSATTRWRSTSGSRSARSSGSCCSRPGASPGPGSAGAALAAIATALALRLPETAAALDPDAPTPPLFHRAAVGPGLALFTGVAAMTAFLLLAGPRAERLGLDGWSLTFLLFGGVVVGCRVIFARVPDRVPPMTLGAGALGAGGGWPHRGRHRCRASVAPSRWRRAAGRSASPS